MALLTHQKKKIFYDFKPGKKPVFVFIHGLGSNHTAVMKLRSVFSLRGFGTLTYDLPGHGFSDPLPVDFETQSNLLVHLLRSLKIKQPILVGCSYGAAIAAAVEQKITCKKIFLITPYTRDTARFPKFVQSLFSSTASHTLPKKGRHKNIDYSRFGILPALTHPVMDRRHVTKSVFSKGVKESLQHDLPLQPKCKAYILHSAGDLLTQSKLEHLKAVATLKKIRGGHMIIHNNHKDLVTYILQHARGK